MKVIVFWVVVLCSPAEVYRRFRGIIRNMTGQQVLLKRLKTCQTTWRNSSEDKFLIPKELWSTYALPDEKGISLCSKIIFLMISCEFDCL
jgi:hypothetical protein